MTRVHELKCWPEHFAAVRRREKPFEVRYNDRDYQVGDTLILHEYIPPERWIEQYDGDGYTGETEIVTVTYVLDDPRWCKPGYVILGLGFEQWRPIETAPKDGTHILVLNLDGYIYEAWWDGKYKHWEFPFANLHGCGCCGSSDDKPTHWQPLPEPPKELSRDGGV